MKRLFALIAITCMCMAVIWPALVQGQRLNDTLTRAIQRGNKAREYLARKGVNLARIKTRILDFDDVGTTHIRYEQNVDGIRVFGREIVTHENARGDFSELGGEVFTDHVPLTVPYFSADQALQLAAGQFGPYSDVEVELVIYPKGKTAHLAWSIDISNTNDRYAATPLREQIIIDAHSGMTIDRWNNLQTAASTGTGYGFYAGTVNGFPIDFTSNTYTMFDVPNNAKTTDFNNGTCGFFGCRNNVGTIYSSSDNIFGTTGALTDRASIGVDAHYFAQRTLGYWLATFGRNGIDNNNNKSLKYKYMLSRTHYGNNYNNAFWDGSSMNYGDGNGTTYRPFDAVCRGP